MEHKMEKQPKTRVSDIVDILNWKMAHNGRDPEQKTLKPMTEREIVVCAIRQKDGELYMTNRISGFQEIYDRSPRANAKDTTERVLGLALDEFRRILNDYDSINKPKRKAGIGKAAK
jgi:hypothetical protein